MGYAWLGNVVRADEGVVRLAMIGAMATLFVIALTIPESFEDLPGGLPGPVVFAVGYFAVRLARLSMFWAAGRTDPGLRRQLVKFTPSVLVGTTMLLIASQLTETAQIPAWVAALIGDLVGTPTTTSKATDLPPSDPRRPPTRKGRRHQGRCRGPPVLS